SRRWRRWNR
nr:Chain C, 9-meric peptide from Voltage-dependent L-type calcium channel subunit alpha-1D [Homo sapiens]